jgi:hypothetical protein
MPAPGGKNRQRTAGYPEAMRGILPLLDRQIETDLKLAHQQGAI